MKNRNGFTLLEMVITMAVIIILSLVSVPMFSEHALKAKLSEGYTLLGAIRDAQKQYYSEYLIFLCSLNSSAKGVSNTGFTCNDEVLGIDARGNKYFTWFNVGDYANSSSYTVFVRSAHEGSITYAYNKSSGATMKWNY